MILKVHLQGAPCYEVGNEIWQQSLVDAITAEAEMIASYAEADLLQSPDQAHRDALRDRIVREMTSALVSAGDHYTALDGVMYSLLDAPAVDLPAGEGRLTEVSAHAPDPIVEHVLRFENLPLGSVGTRRAIVRFAANVVSTSNSTADKRSLFPRTTSSKRRTVRSGRSTSAGIATGFSRRRIARRDPVKPSLRGSSRRASDERLRKDLSRPRVRGVVPSTGARRAVRRLAAIE